MKDTEHKVDCIQEGRIEDKTTARSDCDVEGSSATSQAGAENIMVRFRFLSLSLFLTIVMILRVRSEHSVLFIVFNSQPKLRD